GQVGHIVLWYRHSAQELALGADHVNALGNVGDLAGRARGPNARGHPQVAFHVHAYSVAAPSLVKVVYHSPVAQLSFRRDVKTPNLAIAALLVIAVHDVQGLAVRRDRD